MLVLTSNLVANNGKISADADVVYGLSISEILGVLALMRSSLSVGSVYTFTTSPNAKDQALTASFRYAFYIAYKIDLKLMQSSRCDTVLALGLDDANAYLEE